MQTTLAGPCSVSGRGYWTGEANTLTFVPAPANSGIQFVRTDLPGKPRVKALAEFAAGLPMRTRLSHRAAEVDMIEHVMAALYAMQIDNIEVHCTAAEMPGMDGSSLAYALALDSAQCLELPEERQQYVVHEPIRVGNDEQYIDLMPSDDPGLHFAYSLDYGESAIGRATFEGRLHAEFFLQELASARTFISQSDALALQSQGIAGHVTDQDLLVFDDQGPVNNKLRFPDECARHKALDLIGDLALCGFDLVGSVVARCSGHQLNGQLARAIRERLHPQLFHQAENEQYAA